MSKRPLGLEDAIPFGKYKGTKIRVLLHERLDYVQWLCANMNSFQLDKQASERMEELEELIQERRDENPHQADCYPWQ